MLCSLEGGTGFALFITKAIAEAHNSQPDKCGEQQGKWRQALHFYSVIAPVRTAAAAATSAARAQKAELDPESLKDIRGKHLLAYSKNSSDIAASFPAIHLGSIRYQRYA